MGWGQLAWLDLSTMLSFAATVAAVVGICFVPLVILRRKEPASTVAWILVLLFMPIVGVVLFWYFGRDRVRRPVRERRAINAPVRGRIESRVMGAQVTGEADVERMLANHSDEEQRGVMRLALRAGSGDIRPGNAVEVLVGAEPTYAAMLDAIEGAKDHVHLEYYIFRADQTGQRFLDALTRAAKRGVRVRLLYDGFGSTGLARRAAALRAAGGQVKAFFPLDPIRQGTTINLRNHRKLAVVDGRVGFAGGINIGDEFRDWRDLHLRIEGPAVAHLQAVFAEDWHFAARRDLTAAAFFPEIWPVGQSLVQIVESGPDATHEAIHRLYFAAAASARRRVWITTPYFVPDRAMSLALQTAALRGVDVRMIVPRESNHRVTFHAGRAFYDELLSAGVRIHEYSRSPLHGKVAVADDANERFATLRQRADTAMYAAKQAGRDRLALAPKRASASLASVA